MQKPSKSKPNKVKFSPAASAATKDREVSRADNEKYAITKEEWMDCMVKMVRRKSDMPNMSDKDIAGTIKRTKAALNATKEAQIDPDMPDCYYWNAKKVAHWINSLGFPDVKKMFLQNNITGRKLITIDTSALNQMGMSDLTRMREVTGHIRKILGTSVPNALRALMRLVPWEMYLKRRARTGVKTDVLTFKDFCKEQGFPYAKLRNNKCAYIPCTRTVEIKIDCRHQHDPEACIRDLEEQPGSDSSSEDSLNYCPSVENTVRKLPVRDRIIQQVLDELIKTVMSSIAEVEAAQAEALKQQMLEQERSIEARVRKIFMEAYEALGIAAPHLSQSRVEFIASVTEELVDDICNTKEILDDIDSFQSYMENSMDPTTMKNAYDIASEFLEDVSEICTMLTLGQLELEALIRDTPCIQSFVDEIIQTAENRVSTNMQNESTNDKSPSRNDATSNDDLLSDRSSITSIKNILSSTRNSLMTNKKSKPNLRLKDIS